MSRCNAHHPTEGGMKNSTIFRITNGIGGPWIWAFCVILLASVASAQVYQGQVVINPSGGGGSLDVPNVFVPPGYILDRATINFGLNMQTSVAIYNPTGVSQPFYDVGQSDTSTLTVDGNTFSETFNVNGFSGTAGPGFNIYPIYPGDVGTVGRIGGSLTFPSSEAQLFVGSGGDSFIDFSITDNLLTISGQGNGLTFLGDGTFPPVGPAGNLSVSYDVEQVPEPASVSLVIGGSLLVLVTRRRVSIKGGARRAIVNTPFLSQIRSTLFAAQNH